jgi:hypothetical protein
MYALGNSHGILVVCPESLRSFECLLTTPDRLAEPAYEEIVYALNKKLESMDSARGMRKTVNTCVQQLLTVFRKLQTRRLSADD